MYFGSTAKGTIYRAAPGASQAEPWIQASAAGLTNVLGVLADDKTNTLWVCQNSTGGRGGAPLVGQTALRSFDLKSGAAKGTYPFPTNGGVCNDMAIAPDGTVYATESFGNRIHRLKPGATALDAWFTDPQLAAVDGVALLADGAVYVNTFLSGKLFRIPVSADGSAGTMVTIETSMPLGRPDGLRTVGPQTLIQAEGQGRLTELTIKDNRAEVRVIQEGLTAAAGVTIVGDTALVLVERAKAVVVARDSEAQMNPFARVLTAAALLASASAEAQNLNITRAGSRPAESVPAENSTGTARVEMLFEAIDPSHASGASVTFEPGARTAWHSHPRGQILIVTAGTGRVQRWGDPIEVIHQRDVVRIPAGAKHWHGAAPQASMTHFAIAEHRDATRVEWMEKVSDEQYHGPSSGAAASAAAPLQTQVQAQPQPTSQPQGAGRPSGPVQQRFAPGLAALTDDVLFGDVWGRPELSPRDRSLVTVSVPIATGKPAQLAGHLGRALTNGVQPSDASGLLAHLAIYCGWPSAVSALEVYEQVYTARRVDTAALRSVAPRLPAPGSDAARAKALADEFGGLAPKFVQLTNDVVLGDLWRRSDLSPRDRSLVTIAALAAMGDHDQLDVYLRRGPPAIRNHHIVDSGSCLRPCRRPRRRSAVHRSEWRHREDQRLSRVHHLRQSKPLGSPSFLETFWTR